MTTEQVRSGTILPFWRAVYEVARKEVLVFTRSKRLYIMGGFYALGFLTLSILMAYTFTRFGDLEQAFPLVSEANLVLAFYLAIPLIGGSAFLQILGIVFVFDAIVREYEDRSLFLVLAKPISREALVLGKFAGGVAAVGSIFMVIGTIAYFIIILMVGSFPSIGDFGRFYAALGVILLGLVAFASMALFFSSVSRSTTMSVLLSFSMWLIVLEVLAYSGLFYAGLSRSLSADHWFVELTQYLNPSTSIGPAVKILVNWDLLVGEGVGFTLPAKGLGLDLGLSLLSLTAFTAAFLLGTMFAVNRRNFE